jgi:uncharacterized protein (UPF0147 family)
MKKSWREYLSKLNHKTPIKKVWDMIRKIKHLEKDQNVPSNVKDISNTLAEIISKKSSNRSYELHMQNV